MILKIRRYSENQDWWIYDDIRKVSISSNTRRMFSDYYHNHDAILFDMEKTCNCDKDGECSDCITCITLILRLNDGTEYILAFDTIAYLLNDNGKTIEKIVANYND